MTPRTTLATAFGALVLALFFLPCIAAEEAQRVETKDIPYYPESVLANADDYQKSQCRLKISAPKDAKNLPVFVWFHGGGLERGALEYPAKETPSLMMNKKVVLVGVGYRLSPKVPFPKFIEDAAAAVAWTFKNIDQYGGDPKKIFVGGHSAGGYLTGMVGLDPRWLKPYGIDNKQIAGLVIHSGQVSTHFHVRRLLKYPQAEYHPIIDENAPMFHISKDSPPTLLTAGDRKLDWPIRVVENEFMAESMRHMKHPHVEFYENVGYDHDRVRNSPETYQQIRQFIEKITGDNIGP